LSAACVNAADAGSGDSEDADALKLPPAAPEVVFPVLVYSASSGDDTLDVEKRDGEEDKEDDVGDDSDNDDSDGGEGVGNGRRNDGSEAL
jgi:hypothetical protein